MIHDFKVDLNYFWFIKVQGTSTSCLYISRYKVWPYQSADTSEINHAQVACADIGLNLAELESEAENTALHEFTST